MEADDKKPEGGAAGNESTGGETLKAESNQGAEKAAGIDPGIIPERQIVDPPIVDRSTLDPVNDAAEVRPGFAPRIAEGRAGAGFGSLRDSGRAGVAAEKGARLQRLGLGPHVPLRSSGHDIRDSELTPFNKFPLNYYDVDDPGVIFENWTLTVGGSVQKPGDYKLAQIQALPLQRQNTRHICVEGWDVIGRFGGTRLSTFLNMIGADTSARYITFGCADDYYETLDMETALHPQTLLCWEMYDRPLTREHGAPLRLQVPTKVGYKQAKYLTDLKVTNVIDKVGYWEDQGYDYFYGL